MRAAIDERILSGINDFRKAYAEARWIGPVFFLVVLGISATATVASNSNRNPCILFSFWILISMVLCDADLRHFLRGASSDAHSVSEEDSARPATTEGTDLQQSNTENGVAIYLRVSSQTQAEKYSLPEQDEKLTELAKTLKPSKTYKLREVRSGADFSRPGLIRLLELAAKGLIKFVVVMSLDRLGRDLIESLYFVRRLRELGVKIVAYSDGETDINTEEGLIKAAIGFLTAQLDRERRRLVTAAGKIRSFKSRHWCLPLPLGYRKRDDGWIEKSQTGES
jgi:DNA invertase Pin-like site-specific DNA recombinase